MEDSLSNSRALGLPHGRTLVLETGSEADTARLLIRAPSGEVEVEVEIGPSGPLLRLRAPDIEIDAARELRLSCTSLSVRSSTDVEIIAARDAIVEAAKGSLRLSANDDVGVVGERILLNADVQPMARSWEELEGRVAGDEESAETLSEFSRCGRR